VSVDAERHGDGAMFAVAGALAVLSVAGLLAVVRADRIADVPVDFPWVWTVAAFAACEAFALRVERRQGEQYGFTAAFVPLAAGLIYAEQGQLVAARVLGVALVLLVLRQRRLPEMVYELAVHLAQTVCAILVVRAVLGDADPVGVRGVVALGLALAASYAVSQAALAALIAAASRGLPPLRSLSALARTDLAPGVLNAAIGIGLALALWDHTSVELLLIAIVVACVASNRVYSRLYERRRGLEALHEFTNTVVRSRDI